MLVLDVLDVRLVVGARSSLLGVRICTAGQVPGDLALDRLEHRAEQLEGLALVLLLRLLLRVAAQVDALAQVVERREVLAPVRVDDCSITARSYWRIDVSAPAGELGAVGLVARFATMRSSDLLVAAAPAPSPAISRTGTSRWSSASSSLSRPAMSHCSSTLSAGT